MKRKITVLLVCLAMALSLAPMAAAVDDVTVTVYATNDIHGVVAGSETAIGLQLAAEIAAGDRNSILVDAGDATQGSSFATVSEGADVIWMMNAAAYDVMAAGNHEFDYGVDQLLSNAEAANFPILSANVTYNGKALLDGHAVVERDGKKIGFIGLTTTSTVSNADPAGLEGVKFESEITAAKREIAAIADETDAIILICHMGNNESAVETTSKKLLDGLTNQELALVTAVVDGHSHTLEDGTPYVRGSVSVPVIQAGTQMAALGQLTLTFSGDTVTAKGSVMTYEDATAWKAPDDRADAVARVAEVVEDTYDQILENQEKTLGEKLIDNSTPVWGGNVYWDYSENRIVETAYGDLVTDAFVSKATEFAKNQGLSYPIIAVENGGGIAVPMFKGEVTYGDILDAFNHGNTVVAKTVTPAQLYTALEVGLTMTGQDETGLLTRERVSGSFLQVSGFTYTYDPAGESGQKVTAVALEDGTALARNDSTTKLLLATNSYVASSLDGIADGEQLGELCGEDMAVRDWLMVLTENGTVPLNYPVSAGRIRYANDKSPETYTVSIPVLNSADEPAANTTVHVNVDGGEYKEYTTDEDGLLKVTVPNGPQVIGISECEIPVYVNNYSGSGTVTTKTGYCEFAFHINTGFVDVPTGEWYYDAVNTVYRAGLMKGISTGRFDPTGTVSRAMAVQVIWNIVGSTKVDYPMTFTDVKDDFWYTDAIRWAVSAEVVDGVGDNKFAPDSSVTREQFAAMLYRYAASIGYGFEGGWVYEIEGYSDTANISSWASSGMSWCVMNGIIRGSDGKLDPKGTLTRAELAQMLTNYIAEG